MISGYADYPCCCHTYKAADRVAVSQSTDSDLEYFQKGQEYVYRLPGDMGYKTTPNNYLTTPFGRIDAIWCH
jgi:hypothetical protein